MIVKEIRIWKKSSYEGANANRFVAKVEIESPNGNMEIPLAPEVADRMIEFLAPVVAEFSRRAVEQILGDITSQVQALRAPPVDATLPEAGK